MPEYFSRNCPKMIISLTNGGAAAPPPPPPASYAYLYRHPHSDLSAFMSSLNNNLDKINNEQKYCVLMGDFNLNLLNSDSHLPTDEFLNSLGTYFYNPHILQHTRITSHSATLIDNIFFNSLSHHTVSGNVVYDLSDHLPNFNSYYQ